MLVALRSGVGVGLSEVACAGATSGPGRRRRAATTAPPAALAQAHQHAVSYPCASARSFSAAWPIELVDDACATAYDATAEAKIVFRSDVPMDAPSCWPTVTVADATPASCGATP